MDDLAANIKAGQMDFDILIASPDAMRLVGQLGQILGLSWTDAQSQGWHSDTRCRPGCQKRRLARFSTEPTKPASSTAPIGQASFEVDALKSNLLL